MNNKIILVDLEKQNNNIILKAKYLNNKKEFEICFMSKDKDSAYKKFSEFCKNDCEFDNSSYCYVYLLNSSKSKFQESFYSYLSSVDWCCVSNIEFEYSYLNVHLKEKSFKQFKNELIDNRLTNLENFEKIYYYFNDNYKRRTFNEKELETMQFYVYDNYELIYRNYNNYIIKLKMQIALSRILENDKDRFNKIMEYISSHHERYKSELDNRLYSFLKDTCYNYSELHDYEDFSSRDVYNEKLAESKYYKLFLDNNNKETIDKIVKNEGNIM